MRKVVFLSIILTVLFAGCKEDLSPENKIKKQELQKHRTSKNTFMKNSPSSPLSAEQKKNFEGLKYFDFNPDFIFESKLYEYDPKDTVLVKGTKGEDRQYVKYGYVKINYQGKTRNINVYESEHEGIKYYSIWFTDKTTNDESYGVGRYLDFEKSDDPENVYTIDFNYAYNPFCAYNSRFSCAIPRKEDHINFAIEAGERKYHK